MATPFKGMLLMMLIAICAACATVPATPIALTAPAATTPAATLNPIDSAAPTATPVRPATLAPTATPVPTATSVPTPTALPPLVIDDTWTTYTNAKYGFSFQYPSDWKLKEITGTDNTMSGRAVYLLHPTDPTVRVIVAFKHADEDVRIAPTGMGGGELVSRGGVSLLGQEVERLVRVELGKDMTVFYGWPRSTTTGGSLVFWLALDCVCSASDPAVAGLTSEVEQIADAVVESIAVNK